MFWSAKCSLPDAVRGSKRLHAAPYWHNKIPDILCILHKVSPWYINPYQTALKINAVLRLTWTLCVKSFPLQSSLNLINNMPLYWTLYLRRSFAFKHSHESRIFVKCVRTRVPYFLPPLMLISELRGFFNHLASDSKWQDRSCKTLNLFWFIIIIF